MQLKACEESLQVGATPSLPGEAGDEGRVLGGVRSKVGGRTPDSQRSVEGVWSGLPWWVRGC